VPGLQNQQRTSPLLHTPRARAWPDRPRTACRGATSRAPLLATGDRH
jgi:hypothetical protein